MTGSSFLLLSRAEFIIHPLIYRLQPRTNTAFTRRVLQQFSGHSFPRSGSLYGTQPFGSVFNKQESSVTKVGSTEDAKNEHDSFHEYSAAIYARNADKVPLSQLKERTSISGAQKLSELVAPYFFEGGFPMGLAASFGTVAAIFVMLVLGFWQKSTENEGSVSDLVKRGQLRSDRKAASTPFRYDDPFNNPMVKAESKNPLISMCGKIFRLAPVKLTEEKIVSHQNRRIQAYQWKRPVVSLNEGDSVPDGVDPEEIRWIPSNHPFATSTNYIDEESSQIYVIRQEEFQHAYKKSTRHCEGR